MKPENDPKRAPDVHSASTEAEKPSKTALKKEMLALQALGKELCAMPLEKLRKGPLSEALLDAIALHQKCKSFGARKRQEQFIGKVMRNEEGDEIRAWLDGETVEQKLQVLHMHAAESWRDVLVENPSRLAEFLESYPEAAQAGLNAVIRAAATERQAKKPPKNTRQLYQQLYQIIQKHEAES